MNKNVIPMDVQEFILQYISCVAQIEALLLFRSEPEKEWDTVIIENRLYLSPAEVKDLMDEMVNHGLISKGNSSYRYDPCTVRIKEMIERVLDVYSRSLLPVTHLIHSKSKDRLQEFADAFKVRKDKD